MKEGATMSILTNIVQSLTTSAKWIALTTMGIMMSFITIGVISRALGYPILGDVELVQIMMVILIMFGLAYSQSKDAHISIGLLVDRFPTRIQILFDIIIYTITFIICIFISWVYVGVGIKNMTESIITTNLLHIPHYPFNFIISIGFFLWAMEALLKVLKSITKLNKKISNNNPETGDVQ
jgi:TRAP-type transport system small permease protein